jgi:hypothetical protein
VKLAAGLVLAAIVVAGCGGEETVASPFQWSYQDR